MLNCIYLASDLKWRAASEHLRRLDNMPRFSENRLAGVLLLCTFSFLRMVLRVVRRLDDTVNVY